MTTFEITTITSLASLKHQARHIKKAQGIKHGAALDLAAQRAGLHNYRHALHTLQAATLQAPTSHAHTLTMTALWKDTDGTFGKESLTVTLTAPWNTLLPADRLGRYDNRHLAGLVAETYPNQLAFTRWRSNQAAARLVVCGAARTFAFMDATRLQPPSTARGFRRIYPPIADLRKVNPHAMPEGDVSFPGKDHVSYWIDPITRCGLIANEPYVSATPEHDDCRVDRCRIWCDTVGFQMASPAWGGMYNPYGGTRLYLLASQDPRRGIPLDPVIAALEALPAPVSDTQWQGESTTWQKRV